MVQLFHNHTSQSYACPVADLGFLRRGRGQTRGGGDQPITWQNVFRKLHENEIGPRALVDPRGWRQGRTLPARDQILSFSCSVRQKKLQNNRLAQPLWELAPIQENPGSATREGKQRCLILIGKTDHVDVSNTVIFVFNPRRKCRCWVKLLVKFKMKPMFLNIMHLSFFMYFNAYYIPMVNWVVESITVQEMFL